jgi:Ser-tRNA(Ala) deacylase AlaX
MSRAFQDHPATEKFYHHDLYATKCTATVLAVEDDLALFDRTIFYAESGGQVADQGYVSGRRVIDVQKSGGDPYFLPNGDCLRTNTRFVHRFEEPVDLAAGETVDMEIDWDRRYRNMQMHTLAHFLFHSINEYLESQGKAASTKGCYISDDSARFDFGIGIGPEAVPVIEDRVRGLVATGEDAEVTKFEDADDVYLWRCAGIEIPCGGTHVHSAK